MSDINDPKTWEQVSEPVKGHPGVFSTRPYMICPVCAAMVPNLEYAEIHRAWHALVVEIVNDLRT